MRKKSWLSAPYIIIWICMFAALIGLYTVRLEQDALYQKQAQELSEQIESQIAYMRQMSDLRVFYESDEYIEQLARERLGFIRQDEIIFIITSD